MRIVAFEERDAFVVKWQEPRDVARDALALDDGVANGETDIGPPPRDDSPEFDVMALVGRSSAAEVAHWDRVADHEVADVSDDDDVSLTDMLESLSDDEEAPAPAPAKTRYEQIVDELGLEERGGQLYHGARWLGRVEVAAGCRGLSVKAVCAQHDRCSCFIAASSSFHEKTRSVMDWLRRGEHCSAKEHSDESLATRRAWGVCVRGAGGAAAASSSGPG